MTPQKVYLKDYQAPAFSVESLHLNFDLHEDFCRVQSTAKFIRTNKSMTELFLDGEDLQLASVTLNDHVPSYEIQATGLLIKNVPDQFVLKIETKLKPQENTSLEGLYKSGSIVCTQCEAQGFRKITYFMDRPDVMTSYTVRIEADHKTYPILLSNGDRVEQGKVNDQRHYVIWKDPFKKPCYLFALVAGDLGVLKDTFVTKSGKKVDLEIYASHGFQAKCEHAMESLKKSMKWDEERFGREYDLSTYMILAADDFNAGAMENKGLNIFNSRLVFADPKSASDVDYYNIESVIAHEYFHNWTGNRVTLRDWFHLSLKEGLTVFRDQEFSMDMSSRAMVRIDNVDDLRSSQFAEDAGPNAHPIRPASCYAVDNFFTSTIYEKGSEVIRMMQTMVGRPGFRKGMDNYFNKHDGQAVIIEDFASAIAEPNQQDWSQFKLWYSQAGTPKVKAQEKYSEKDQTYTLTLKQECPQTAQEKADNIQKKPFHIPLMIGLLDSQGRDMTLISDQVHRNSEDQNLLHLKQESQEFVFKNVKEKPVLSLNRQFSSPIHLETEAGFNELLFLMKHDSDAFNRWEASQKIYLQELSRQIADIRKGSTSVRTDAKIIEALGSIITDQKLDAALKAKLLTAPTNDYLAQLESVLDGPSFQKAQDNLAHDIGRQYEKALLEIYHSLHGKNLESKDAKDFANRRLKNLCLYFLSFLPTHHALVFDQYKNAKIMTDEVSAFMILTELESNLREEAIQRFHDKWKSESLVMNKWFTVQANSAHKNTFKTVAQLMKHPEFNIKNPNRVYALLRTFGGNFARFHDPAFDTYTFMADRVIELDKLNPQVAARIVACFDVWEKLPEGQQTKAKKSLERMLAQGLSSNTHEIVVKALG